MCVLTGGQLCFLILKLSWHFIHALTKTPLHAHPDTQHTSLPYWQDCVYVEADNTTGLNPSTCDFLQTGLVPVYPLNSP